MMTTFLDLPAELRNHVYELAMLDQTSLDIRPSYHGKIRLPDLAHQVAQPPITRTCRLVRRDTLPIFYGETLFTFRIHRPQLWKPDDMLTLPQAAGVWLHAIGRQNRAMIRKLFMYGRAHHAYALVQAERMEVEEGTAIVIARLDEPVGNAHTLLWRANVGLDVGIDAVWRVKFGGVGSE